MESTEIQIQTALFQWANLSRGKYPELNLMYHVGNERKCSPAQGHRLKLAGVKSGVPDVCLPAARKGYHGLFIELKRDRTCKPSPEQTDWLNRLTAAGYFATVCHGLDSAVRTIEWYLGGME